MTPPSEATQLFAAFKSVLKSRKITYKDLADRTQTAESTIKRIFSLEECSLGRLMELLAAVELSLADLMEFVADGKVEVSMFTAEAEEFLAAALDYFYFYRKLFHHRDVGEVQKRLGLSRRDVTKYLKKLDDLRVIKWLPDDHVQFAHAEFLRFRDDGPLKAAVQRDWTPKFHALVLDRLDKPGYGLRLFSARCSPELQSSFATEYAELVESFLKRANLERKTQPERLRSFAVSLASGPFRVGLDDSDY